MQNETSLYEIPAHQLLMADAEEKLGAGQELGEAEVVSTMFGKAKVRIIYKQERSGGRWLLVALAVLGILVGVAFWVWQAEPLVPETGSATVSPLQVKPLALPEPIISVPATSAPQTSAPQLPEQQISAPAAEKTITAQPAMQQPIIQQPEKTAPVKPAPLKEITITSKPKTKPVVASNDQPKHPAEKQRPAQSPAVPLSIKPAMTEPAIQITKTPPVHTADQAQEKGAKLPSADTDQQPVQAGTQP